MSVLYSLTSDENRAVTEGGNTASPRHTGRGVYLYYQRFLEFPKKRLPAGAPSRI